MPLDHGRRLDQHHQLQTARPQPVKPDPQQTVDGVELSTPGALPMKDVQLMAEGDYLQFQFRTATKPVNQHGKDRVYEREHAGNPMAAGDHNSSVFNAFEVLRSHSRKPPKRVRLMNGDRLLFVWLCRLCPSILDSLRIIKPETVIGWHRRGLRAYWRWRFRAPGGRPRIHSEIRKLIGEMSVSMSLHAKRVRTYGVLTHISIDHPRVTRTRCVAPSTSGIPDACAGSTLPSSVSWDTPRLTRPGFSTAIS
jgi:hypothetical protein